MSIRLTPHILSLIDWSNPLDDPLRIQFIPMKSTFVPDHPKLTLDSLHEADDSPVQGLVHRYPDKVLFLGSSHPSPSPSVTPTYNIKSNLSLRPLLPFLHALLRRRRQHRNRNQEPQQTHKSPLGRRPRIHRRQPVHLRRRRLRG